MTAALQEIFGELSSLSPEKQQVAASFIHSLWVDDNRGDEVHPEWHKELDKRSEEIASGQVQALSKEQMDTRIADLRNNGN